MKRSVEERFWEKVNKSNECWLWTAGLGTDGYGMFRLNGHNVVASRWAYEALVGPIPEGLLVCHHCDTPRCVRPEHLFVGTVLDNIRDMDQKGRRSWARGDKCGARTHPESQPRGARHGMARLTETDVLAIRAALEEGTPAHKLAAKYRVSRALITLIKQRHLWAHI